MQRSHTVPPWHRAVKKFHEGIIILKAALAVNPLSVNFATFSSRPFLFISINATFAPSAASLC